MEDDIKYTVTDSIRRYPATMRGPDRDIIYPAKFRWEDNNNNAVYVGWTESYLFGIIKIAKSGKFDTTTSKPTSHATPWYYTMNQTKVVVHT